MTMPQETPCDTKEEIWQEGQETFPTLCYLQIIFNRTIYLWLLIFV